MPPQMNNHNMETIEAREIDEIFLNSSISKRDSIQCLIDCTNELPKLYPYLDVIERELKNIRKTHSAHDIRLEVLSESLNTIHHKNRELEGKINKDLALYEHLKELVMALTIESENIETLENGSFNDPEALGMMEKTISLLVSIDLEKYTIKAVVDKIEETKSRIEKFLKRFLMFLKGIFKSTAKNGELQVHKEVYKRMKQYLFIYELSKGHGNYYEILSNMYIVESRRMYEDEFAKNIEILNSLVDSSKKIDVSIEVLLKSFESLIGCEVRFLKYMGFTKDDRSENGSSGKKNAALENEIFEGISAMIIDFIDGMYEKAPLPTLMAINAHMQRSGEEMEFHKKFKGELERKNRLLEDLYLSKLKEKKVDMEKIYLLNYVQRNRVERLGQRLLEILVEKLSSVSKDTSMESAMNRLQCLHAIREESELKRQGIARVEKIMPRLVTGFVFDGEDEVENMRRLIGMVDLDQPGGGEMLTAIKPLVMENTTVDKKQVEVIFTQNQKELNPS